MSNSTLNYCNTIRLYIFYRKVTLWIVKKLYEYLRKYRNKTFLFWQVFMELYARVKSNRCTLSLKQLKRLVSIFFMYYWHSQLVMNKWLCCCQFKVWVSSPFFMGVELLKEKELYIVSISPTFYSNSKRHFSEAPEK